MRVIRICGVVCIAMISSGCSTVSKNYGKGGHETHVIRCDAAGSLSVCREQAKADCPRGYKTISETTGVNRKEIRVICKNKADSVTKGTSSVAAIAVTPP